MFGYHTKYSSSVQGDNGHDAGVLERDIKYGATLKGRAPARQHASPVWMPVPPKHFQLHPAKCVDSPVRPLLILTTAIAHGQE